MSSVMTRPPGLATRRIAARRRPAAWTVCWAADRRAVGGSTSRTRAASASSTWVRAREPADDRRQDDHRDVAVDVEEGDVEAGEAARAHERVLVDEQSDHHE